MKVLVWNIKFFSLSRIVGQTATKYATAENLSRTKNDAARALATLSYIVSTVKRSAPDVFVVVEPRASEGAPGTLADSTSGGPAGLIQLLAHLRSTLGNTWYLVPPQRINSTQIDIIDGGSRYTECIGVFWNSAKVTFTGPWNNTAAGPAAGGVAIAYTGAYADVVPLGTTAAGTTSFGLPGFPDPTSRRPFLTSFTEIAHPQRLLDLYSVHCDTYRGVEAVRAIRYIPFTITLDKVILVAGDFNVDVSAPTGIGYIELNNLFDHRFARLYPGPSTNPIVGWPSFGPTMLCPGPDATPGQYWKKQTLDFGLLRFGSPAAGDYATSQCQAIDRVAGTPTEIGRAMSYALADFLRAQGPISADKFRDRFNYGKIGTPAAIPSSPAVLADGTSDHLPILLTV